VKNPLLLALLLIPATATLAWDGRAPNPLSESSLQTELRLGETVRRTQVRRVFMTCGTNQYMTVVPDGGRLDTTQPNRVIFSGADWSYYITLRLLRRAGEPPGPVEVGDALRIISEKFPGASVTGTNSTSILGATGPTIEFSQAANGVPANRGRLALIPVEGGIWEIATVANPRHNDADDALHFITLNFRSNESGPIEIMPMPDQS
jgi:hypothetical protein